MKILIGGSPCTHWSIAQTKNRETEASGIGWELFLNYCQYCGHRLREIGRERFCNNVNCRNRYVNV